MNFKHGQFNSETNKFFNSVTGKWVVRLRPTSKGKHIGKQRGASISQKYNAIGRPKKIIQIPVNTDVELIREEANKQSLNHEHCLFILYKLLYNRIRLRNALKHDRDYLNNFTPLGATELYKWLGKKYVKCLQLLMDLSIVIVKKSGSGRKAYWNDKVNGKTSVYKIEERMFDRSLFDFMHQFKSYELTDLGLNIKLHNKKSSNLKVASPIVHLLTAALQGVKLHPDVTGLLEKHLPETVEEMQFLINDVNNGDIYVKPELDKYGERFHSTFTFTWSTLRPLIYFEGKPKGTTYIDLSNSQYYFFSQLVNQSTYRLIPEYEKLIPLFVQAQKYSSFIEFCKHAQEGTLYQWCVNSYELNKTDLMKIFFGSKDEFKTKRKKLKWLVELIEQIQIEFGVNILPKVLQRLESRTLLDEVCSTFLTRYNTASLISIHDGVLIETRMADKFKEVLSETFSKLNFAVPVFKEINYL